jgi:hypothetical protein
LLVETRYSKLSEGLHACCVKSFDKCRVSAKYGRPQKISEPAALEACLEQFSPEHQPRVAVPGAPASRTAVAERPSLEQQYESCPKERSQCQLRLNEAEKEQLAALGKRVQASEALTTALGACRANAAALQTKRIDLEHALQKVGSRPGAAALAAFPQGPGSIELGLCAAGALIAGFLLGRAGRRHGWAKFAAGSLGALLALLVFIGIIALLPDSRWPERLLSLTTALLLMSLTALRRFARLPHRGAVAVGKRVRGRSDRSGRGGKSARRAPKGRGLTGKPFALLLTPEFPDNRQ